jgi:hypothetical protein
LSAAIKLGTPEPGFFHFGPRLTWILQSRTFVWHLIKKWLDQKGPKKVANDQKINLASKNFLVFFCRKTV